ncbi:MAG: hypothetical protein SPJ92_03210 [Bariatricus sp.]|nr:hypothetical protein [Bariatricus sp.]
MRIKLRKAKQLLCTLFWCIMLAAFGGQALPVLAAETGTYQPDKLCSMTLKLENLNTPMENTEFEVYQVGEVLEGMNLEFQWLDCYRSMGILPDQPVYASDAEEAVLLLEEVVDQNTLICRARANEEGRLQIENLEQGIYFVKQYDPEEYGKVSPFLVFLPYGLEEKWIYDLTIFPKAERIEVKTEINTESAEAVGTGDMNGKPFYMALLGATLAVMILMIGRTENA